MRITLSSNEINSIELECSHEAPALWKEVS